MSADACWGELTLMEDTLPFKVEVDLQGPGGGGISFEMRIDLDRIDVTPTEDTSVPEYVRVTIGRDGR